VGAKHHEKTHTFAKNKEITASAMGVGGDVTMTIKVVRPFDLKGDYYVRLIFTGAEIDAVYRQSIAGTAKGLVDKSAKFIAKTV
jgi:hypothetical protein